MIELCGASKQESKLIKKVYKATLSHFKQKDIFKAEICFVSETEVQELNLEKRGIDKVTDVLSFPFLQIEKLPVSRADFFASDCDKCGRVLLGSLAICRERAIEQSKDYGHSVEREISFLTAHGLLHLLGFDHEEGKAQESEMFEIQESILKNCKMFR
ncbi:MAG: rRNA maturation RNase YbeY [Clostridia bacterium]|nr:rRNA maturation RNase YbeY [Clostridia bacterium]